MLHLRGLKLKLIPAFLTVGMIPAAVLGWRTFRATTTLEEDQRKGLRTVAASVIDKIDRNLYERYGDARALASNPDLPDRTNWYRAGAAKNRSVRALNSFVRLRGFYPVILLVDRDGKVAAVNDVDMLGNQIDTSKVYARNFKDAEWFQAVMEGRFQSNSDGSFTGAYVEKPRIDEEVNSVFGDVGLVASFSAPVLDKAGKTIGVVNIRTMFSLIEEVVVATYQDLKTQGLPRARVSVLDEKGQLLIDYDPARDGGDLAVKHDMNMLLKANLAEDGVQGAQRVVAGETGANLSYDGARKKRWEACGYAASKGALGFPGLKWGVLVRAEQSELSAAPASMRKQVGWILCCSVLALAAVAWLLSNKIAKPLLERMEALKSGAEQVANASGQVASSAQSLSDGATRQAASLEETSASMEEMNSMVRQSSQAADTVTDQMRQADAQARESNEALEEMLVSMKGIEDASHKVSKIIRTIEEIAFQTNLLALNAAVEAARAGQAGAGFAVVADEVRNLAERASQAAKETSGLIEESMAKSEEGSRKVTAAAESVTRIATAVSRVKALIDDVGEGSRQQAKGIEQVSSALVQMENVTQQTAATAEESAAASQELSAQAENALGLVHDLQVLLIGRAG